MNRAALLKWPWKMAVFTWTDILAIAIYWKQSMKKAIEETLLVVRCPLLVFFPAISMHNIVPLAAVTVNKHLPGNNINKHGALKNERLPLLHCCF